MPDTTSNTALFIVDVQGDFLPPTGSLQVPGGLLVVPAIAELLDDKAWDWKLVIASQVGSPALHFSPRRVSRR